MLSKTDRTILAEARLEYEARLEQEACLAKRLGGKTIDSRTIYSYGPLGYGLRIDPLVGDTVEDKMTETLEAESFVIILRYDGAKGWSVNHKNVGGHPRNQLTPEAAGNRDEIIWRVKNALANGDWVPHAPLRVKIQGVFTDRAHACDVHNISKMVCDAVEDGIRAFSPPGVNDKDFQVICNLPGEAVGIAPYIRIEVSQL